MRIVTRPDFDGIVCAVLLKDALKVTQPIKWVEPNAMQHGLIQIQPEDVIANLAHHPTCSLWFDHHESNRIAEPFEGVFRIAPSASGIIFEYFKEDKDRPNPFRRDYSQLVEETDKIDSASVSLEEVLHPENYPYVALSTTIASHNSFDEPYWNRLVELLMNHGIHEVLEDPEVKQRIKTSVKADKLYRNSLEKCTAVNHHITLTDFRSLDYSTSGNRFLVFSLFPKSVVNIKVRFESTKKEKVVISIGHSIFNRGCQVSAGEICSLFGGGGHRGAGSCSVPANQADQAIATVTDILLKNQPSSFPILYEDHFLIAVDKPPGLKAEGSRVVNYKGALFPLFALETEVSGIVLFAKNQKTKTILEKMARRGEIKRTYVALVHGHPPNQEGNINSAPYWQLKEFDGFSLLEIETLIEREPQIRAYLSRWNTPVVGDRRHGASDDHLNRLALHAYFVAFTHPVSQKRIVVETPIPQLFLKKAGGE
jgi:23S rRNA-/tRNA-specific pseudouridylate synthase